MNAITNNPSFQDARNAKANPDGSPNILRFGGGLMLWVMSSGSKAWRCQVQRNGKRTTLNLGHFPAMSIVEARAARMKVRTSSDPARERRVEREEAEVAKGNTLRDVAARWIKARSLKAHWVETTRDGIGARLETYVFPKLGNIPIAEVTPGQVSDLITAIHDRHPRTAIFVKQHLSAIFDFAVRWRMVTFQPVRAIAEDLPTRPDGDEKPRAYVSTIEDARAVLAAVEARASTLNPTTVLVHRFLALTAVRKRELLGARWSEIDFEAAVWTVPAERMKGKFGQRREHAVALAPQAIEVLRAAERIRTSEFIFPSAMRGKATIEDSTLNEVMQRALAFAGLVDEDDRPVMVPHGWRGTFSTIMNELDPASFRIVDVMLAHKHFRDSTEARGKATVEGRYNHARYQSARHRVACQWADMLLDGAPTALALIGLDGTPKADVVVLADRRAA